MVTYNFVRFGLRVQRRILSPTTVFTSVLLMVTICRRVQIEIKLGTLCNTCAKLSANDCGHMAYPSAPSVSDLYCIIESLISETPASL